jgi:hypothetical protein
MSEVGGGRCSTERRVQTDGGDRQERSDVAASDNDEVGAAG